MWEILNFYVHTRNRVCTTKRILKGIFCLLIVAKYFSFGKFLWKYTPFILVPLLPSQIHPSEQKTKYGHVGSKQT